MFKEPFKRALTIIAYVYMFKEPFKRSLTIIAYVYMFKEPFKRSLTITANVYMFKECLQIKKCYSMEIFSKISTKTIPFKRPKTLKLYPQIWYVNDKF